MPNPLMQAALEYEAMGYSVIPLKPKDKISLVQWEQYQHERASREQIGKWWRTWPKANIGIATGHISGIDVIDADSKEAATDLKRILGDLSNVAIVQTGRKPFGCQLYFRAEVTLHNKTAVKPDIDFRGDGGYVVAPPSIHPNGTQYEWLKPLNGELPALPQAFIDLMSKPEEGSYKAPFDTARAINGLPLGQRDDGMFKLACKLRGADVPYEIALQLCEQAAANCEPPFLEAKRKVDRAYKYSPGRPAQQALWPELKRASDALVATPDTERWLWNKTLPVGSCSMLVAKPKVGKSCIAVGLSIAVCRGLTFLGRECRRGSVVYLFLDGPADDIKEQFVKAGLRDDDELYWHAGSPPAQTIAWATQMIKDTKANLVVIDTLQKFFQFKDLSDYAEITAKMEPMLNAIRDAEAHMLLLHHAGKYALDEMDSAIGSTVLRGQAFTTIHVKKLPDTEVRILRSEQRGGKDFEEVAIEFEGADHSGLMVVTGSRREAEIKTVEPKIVELLKDRGPSSETEIRNNLPVRGILVSMALRSLHKNGELETSGVKRSRTDPLKYHIANSLIEED